MFYICFRQGRGHDSLMEFMISASGVRDKVPDIKSISRHDCKRVFRWFDHVRVCAAEALENSIKGLSSLVIGLTHDA